MISECSASHLSIVPPDPATDLDDPAPLQVAQRSRRCPAMPVKVARHVERALQAHEESLAHICNKPESCAGLVDANVEAGLPFASMNRFCNRRMMPGEFVTED